MKNFSQRLALAALPAVFALAACAPVTRVQTNHATDYVARPGRIYVMTVVGMGWGAEFAQAFQQKFTEVARQCGSTAAFGEVSGLELDKNGPMERAAQFQPDTLLAIAQGGGVVTMGGGARLSIVYNATLTDWTLKRPVWRGSFNFARGGTLIPLAERGAVFAVDLTNSLKRDGLLQGCAQIALTQGNRLEEGAEVPHKPQKPHEPLDGAVGTPMSPSAVAPATPDPVAKGMRDLEGLLPTEGTVQPTPVAASPKDAGLAYADLVRRRVRPNILFADTTLSGNPETTVRVHLAPDGAILESSLQRSSGNTHWDEAVLRAVARSDPFPRDANGKTPTIVTITFKPKAD